MLGGSCSTEHCPCLSFQLPGKLGAEECQEAYEGLDPLASCLTPKHALQDGTKAPTPPRWAGRGEQPSLCHSCRGGGPGGLR